MGENCNCQLPVVTRIPWYQRGAATAAMMLLATALILAVLFACGISIWQGLFPTVLFLILAFIMAACDSAMTQASSKRISSISDHLATGFKGPVQ